MELGEQGMDFGTRKHHREALWSLRTRNGVQWRQIQLQDVAIEEEQRTQGDILGGGGDMLIDRQRGKIRPDFGGAHRRWMLLVMKEDKAFDHLTIRILGAAAQMFESCNLANVIEEGTGRHRFAQQHARSQTRRDRHNVFGMMIAAKAYQDGTVDERMRGTYVGGGIAEHALQ